MVQPAMLLSYRQHHGGTSASHILPDFIFYTIFIHIFTHYFCFVFFTWEAPPAPSFYLNDTREIWKTVDMKIWLRQKQSTAQVTQPRDWRAASCPAVGEAVGRSPPDPTSFRSAHSSISQHFFGMWEKMLSPQECPCWQTEKLTNVCSSVTDVSGRSHNTVSHYKLFKPRGQ